MTDIRPIHTLIAEHARISVELLDRFGSAQTNPCPPNTEAHKEWSAAYYTHSLARGIDPLAQ